MRVGGVCACAFTRARVRVQVCELLGGPLRQKVTLRVLSTNFYQFFRQELFPNWSSLIGQTGRLAGLRDLRSDPAVLLPRL